MFFIKTLFSGENVFFYKKLIFSFGEKSKIIGHKSLRSLLNFSSFEVFLTILLYFLHISSKTEKHSRQKQLSYLILNLYNSFFIFTS